MNSISFVSNRRSDTIYMENDPEDNTTTAFSVYVYDYANRSPVLQKISEGPYINLWQPLSPRKNEFFYLSDKNGSIEEFMEKILNRALDYVKQFR